MKVLLLSVLLTLTVSAPAQIFKGLGKKIKDDAEWRLRQKVDQQVNKTLDTAISKVTKPGQKKESGSENNGASPTGNTAKQSPSAGTTATVGENAPPKEEEGMNISEGYVELALSSDEVFRGGTVIIQGSSLRFNNLQTVQLSIKGPETDENETLKLYENNTFTKGFQPNFSGDYTITARSSDGKAKKSMKLKVLDIELTDWERNEEETDRAVDKLKREVERVEQSVGQKDKAELEKRMDEVEEKAGAVKKLYASLNKAMKDLGEATKKGAPLSPTLTANLSQLNDLLSEQKRAMKQVSEKANHEPYDNTVCEYLVMLNEACAAFSTFTNVWTKSVAALVKNIAGDKGVPKATEVANKKAGAIPGDYDVLAKQPAKLFATAAVDAESLVTKMGTASFTGDLVQFATEHLMRTYCGLFKGTVKHDYEIIYRNASGVVWWKYGYVTEGSVTFRYPKKAGGGGTIKMKGNIEGNAVKFSFYQNVEEMDDFKNAMKGRARLTPVKLYAPPHVPFSSSQNDALGFGAVARGLATPAYFNIPVDAEFNTDDNTVKLFLNDALIDFTPMVKFTYGYIALAAGIPLVTRVDFPVNKAKLTLNAVVSKNNELKVEKDAKNNLQIRGTGSRQIGGATAPIEHKISYTLLAGNN